MSEYVLPFAPVARFVSKNLCGLDFHIATRLNTLSDEKHQSLLPGDSVFFALIVYTGIDDGHTTTHHLLCVIPAG